MSMAADSLSQSEIDALFRGGNGARGARGTGQDAEVRLYDFQRPSRISKEQLSSLRAIYGLVTKGLEGWFAGRIRDTITLELENVEPLTFGEFTLALPSPCASYIVGLGLGGQSPGVVEVGREFGFYLVDRFLGGAGAVEAPDRALSLMERAVVQLVVDRLAQQLQEAWHDFVAMELRVSGFESVPEMLQVTSPEDPVLVAHVKVRVQEISSLILICLPFPALEKFFSGQGNRRLTQARGTEEERREEQIRMADHVRRAGLGISARFPAFQVPLGALSALQEGDLLSTGFAPDTELELRISGLPRYMARPGRRGRHRAVAIERRIRADQAKPTDSLPLED
jgi:flagellar motor switch protein FliM